MSDSAPAFVAEFNKVVEECAIFGFITRDSDLQRQASARLRALRARIGSEKSPLRLPGTRIIATCCWVVSARSTR